MYIMIGAVRHILLYNNCTHTVVPLNRGHIETAPELLNFVLCKEVVFRWGSKCYLIKNFMEESFWDLKLCPL